MGAFGQAAGRAIISQGVTAVLVAAGSAFFIYSGLCTDSLLRHPGPMVLTCSVVLTLALVELLSKVVDGRS